MIKGIDNPQNKERIAIVTVGYNRKQGLQRVLDSLNSASYPSNDVPLVISIDASGNQELYSFAREYVWNHGEKFVNIQEERLGLRNHIYQCGDLTKYFKAIALFEDDLWVSPFFYQYLSAAVQKYGNDSRICEISLYRNERMGNTGFYFDTLHDGSDCFLWQDVSTWGECWTEQMWSGFREWLNAHDEEYIMRMDIPDVVKSWKRAWSKFFIAYEVDTHKYVLFPHESLTTNFNDAGGEHGGGSNIVQVNVLHGLKQYTFNKVEEMVSYDIYSNNELLYKWLPKQYEGQVCLDLYGSRNEYHKRYVLSMMDLPFKVVERWGLEMRPLELNIFYKIKGDGIRLYELAINRESKKHFLPEVVPYMLRGFKVQLLFKYVFSAACNKIVNKLRKH